MYRVVFFILLSFAANAQLEVIQSQSEIKAVQLNSNFEELRTDLNQENLNKGYTQSEIDALGSLIILHPVDINDTIKDVIKAADLNANFNYLKNLANNAKTYSTCSSLNASLFGYDMTNANSISGQGPDSCVLTCDDTFAFNSTNKNCESTLTNMILTLDNNGENLYDWQNVTVVLSQSLIDANGIISADDCSGNTILENGDTCTINISYDSAQLTLVETETITSLPYSLNEVSISGLIEAPSRACLPSDMDLVSGGDSSNVATVTGIVTESEPTAAYSCLVDTCSPNYIKDNNSLLCLSNQCTLSDASSNGSNIINALSATGIKTSVNDFSNCYIGICNTDYYVISAGLDCSESAMDVGLSFDSSVNYFNDDPGTDYSNSTTDLNSVYDNYVLSGEDVTQSGESADTWRSNLLGADLVEDKEVRSEPLNAKWQSIWYKIQDLKNRMDTLEAP